MYKCKCCKNVFEEPKIEIEVVGADNQNGFIEYQYCPYCDSSEFDIIKCKNCGKEIENIFELYQDNKKNICLKCFESEN